MPRVSAEMNASLKSPLSGDEVKTALNNIGDLKAPGPGGMHAGNFL